MKKNKIIILTLLILVVLPFIFSFTDFSPMILFFTSIIGLIGIFILYSIQSISAMIKGSYSKWTIFLQITIALMTFTFMTKYYYFSFGDYPSLFILPLFIISVLYYLFREKQKDSILILTTIVFVIFTIPLFGFKRSHSPEQFIPTHWYNRYNITLVDRSNMKSFEFLYKETGQLLLKGHKLKDSELYYEAIPVYRSALNYEPKNPGLYYYLSECYARINDLEHAVLLLDTAIMLDSTYEQSYNNRGLLHYKLGNFDNALHDFSKAIETNKTDFCPYGNIAIIYCKTGRYNDACNMLRKAIELGINPNDENFKIINKKCKCRL